MKPSSRGSKKPVFRRREPDFPDDFLTSDPTSLFADRDISITEHEIKEATVQQPNGGTLRIEESIMEKVSFSDCRFYSVILKDVRLVNCDLANFEARSLQCIRVELVNCRMTGFRAGEADCQDLLISEGDQRYSQFRFSKLPATEFHSCNLSEADFQGTDLSGSVFRKCNLQNVEMSKVTMVNTDLRGSQIDGLQLNAEDIRGAIVDAAQALQFASLLGIRIE